MKFPATISRALNPKLFNVQIILNAAQLRKILNALSANTHSSTLPFYPQILLLSSWSWLICLSGFWGPCSKVTKTHLERKITLVWQTSAFSGTYFKERSQKKSLVFKNLLPNLGRKIQNPRLSWRADGSGIFLHNLRAMNTAGNNLALFVFLNKSLWRARGICSRFLWRNSWNLWGFEQSLLENSSRCSRSHAPELSVRPGGTAWPKSSMPGEDVLIQGIFGRGWGGQRDFIRNSSSFQVTLMATAVKRNNPDYCKQAAPS